MNKDTSETILTAVFIRKGKRRAPNQPASDRQAPKDPAVRHIKPFKITVKPQGSRYRIEDPLELHSNSASNSKPKSVKKGELKRVASSRLIGEHQECSHPSRNLRESIYSPMEGLRKSRRLG